MRELSAETMKAQIEELAPEWDSDLTWDQREGDGAVFLAVLKPTIIPLGQGVAMMEDVAERICTLGPDYPFSAAMRHRRKFYETAAGIYARVASARAARRRETERQIEDADHEIRKDVLAVAKDRISISMAR